MARIVMTADQIRRGLVRIAHEVVERGGGAESLALVGVRSRGVPLAERLADAIEQIEGRRPPTGAVDISLYRDDASRHGVGANLQPTTIDFQVDDTRVVLVDDVLFTGRTVRSAMDALIDLGRPALIQLAVLVDRGHRELPIRADYVCKNIPTSREEKVSVRVAEVDGDDCVLVEAGAEPSSDGAGDV